ncbi:MAG: ABC transporter substrate-binding protein [Halanaerobiales bacterium]
MKNRFKLLLIVGLVLIMSVSAFAEKGPVPDKVYFDVRMDQNIGINDVAAGNSDIFYFGVDGDIINGLDEDTLSKLEIYDVPSGSWSLQINPYPNEAPYSFEKDGEEIFNPFAIREVRFAMNFLINRQYIVDEILDGAGGPMYTMATPGQPGTHKYNLTASQYGFTPEGDEERAIADIDAAMQKAAELPENQGKLVKDGEWWTFNGEPVTIKFYIRVDLPSIPKEGEYITQQIEKAGIKVEQLLWDRARMMETVYGGKPEDWGYTIYTESWGAGATRRYWEHIVAQMYSPWYGYMPGGFADGWKYENEKLDQLTQDAYNGEFITEDEYWDLALEGLEIGIEESVRIYVAYQTQYYVANKERFNERFAYGLGDGLTKYTLVTADTEDSIVRATQFSAQGTLFASAWDPVGPDGFSDTYSRYVVEPLYDAAAIESPASGEWVFNRAYPIEVDSDVSRTDDGEIVGHIEVPASAIKYDSAAKEWVEVGEGVSSYSSGLYGLRLGSYHHGVPVSIVDFLYADAFSEDWMTEDYEGDPYYSEAYASYVGGADVHVGSVYDFENEQIANYFDFQFPANENRVAGRGAPSWQTSANAGIGVAWEVSEALARLVVNGGESGENYAFEDGKDGAVEVDVIRPSCVADIRAELEAMVEEKHVPVYIEDFITADEAVERYQAAIDFINDYNHAYISNGPFILSDIDFDANFIELSANRAEDYPFEPGYWMEELKTDRLEVDGFEVPSMVARGEDVLVDVFVSTIEYPEKDGVPADFGDVEVFILTEDEEYSFETTVTRSGVFLAEIPGKITAELEPGSYTVMAIASAEGASPSTVTSTIYLY